VLIATGFSPDRTCNKKIQFSDLTPLPTTMFE
jgi:hypothetical protein